MKRYAPLLHFLVIIAVFGWAAFDALGQSGNTTVTKETMLQNIAHDVILPGYQDLHSNCLAMTNAIGEFNKAPSTNSLQKARQAWLETLLAARRIQFIQSGPVADRELLARLFYSRVLSARVDEAVNSDHLLNDAYLDEIGSIARGMFALEYLLFGKKTYPPTDPKAMEASVVAGFSQPAGKRRKEVLLWLAQDIETKCSLLVKDWSASGPDSASGKFTAGGQKTLNVLVNDLARIVEQVEEERVHLLLQMPPPIASQMWRIEGSASDSSKASLFAMVEGFQKLFVRSKTNSFETYLTTINPKAAALGAAKLDAVATAIAPVQGSLEEAAQRTPTLIQTVYDKLHDLEIFCKVDLASSLGVTITFSSNDGD